MQLKRLTVLCGHYGSGKTNIAVNLAFEAKMRYDRVTVADIDIVNPYYRTKDSAKAFEKAGIRLIVSDFANSNVDVPALPPDLYAVTDDRSSRVIMDVGGDDRGALALGRLSKEIKAENDYESVFVVNQYRPLTASPDAAIEVMREIEKASGLPFTAIINNSNLGDETTADHVLNSVSFISEISRRIKLPVILTTVKGNIYEELKGKIDDLFPLTLQKKIL